MNRDEALKKSDQALEELAASLNQGMSDALMRYLNMLSQFHQYSFGNCMLIALQMPAATFVAGFKRWQQLGRWVRKGEKGIMILAPVIVRRKKEEQVKTESTDGKPASSLVGFRAAYVFDVSQTDGADLPEFAKLGGDPGGLTAKLEAIIRSKGIEFEFAASLAGANGISAGGHIIVLETLEPAQKFSTMAHELAHELLHRGDRREATTKTVRETEAEAVAYVVCRSFGLDCSSRASDYIQLYCGDAQILGQSLELIRDVAAQIIDELESSEENAESSHSTASYSVSIESSNACAASQSQAPC